MGIQKDTKDTLSLETESIRTQNNNLEQIVGFFEMLRYQQCKAMPDVSARQICVSNKCVLTLGERSPKQARLCKHLLVTSSKPCLAKRSVLIFRNTRGKM